MLLMDETFWVAVSILLILAIIYHYSKKPLDNYLTSNAASISNKILEAQALLAEAEKLLEEHKKLHSKHIAQIKTNLKSIDLEIAELKKQAEENFLERVNYKTSVMASRIESEQHKLLNKLRLDSVRLATEIATIVLFKSENSLLHNQILDSTTISAIKIKNYLMR